MAAHMRGTLGRENQIKRPLKLQVHIVEDHNDVLPHVYRAIGSRQIPFSDICLLHFDSHPDMLIPGQLNADNVFDKETLYQELSIENWIIPAIYAGHFNRVVWIKPEWAVQIEDKVTDFIVGKNKQSGKIRLTSKENYFVSELLYSHEEELENCKQLMLQVATLSQETDTKDLKAKIVENLQVEIYERDVVEQDDPQMSKIQQIENSSEYCDDESDDTHGRQQRFISEVIHTKRSCEKNSKCSENSGELTKKRCKLVCDEKDGRDNFVTVARPYILDIDLDFFSTANPFKEMYSEDQYRLLRKLYFCKLPKDADDKVLNDFIKKRTVQLAELKEIFLNMKKGGTLSDSSSERNTLIDELVSDLRRTRKEEDIDYEWLHEAGCTCDDSELPHHISTEDEIKQFMQKVKDLLQNLPRPALVTIARSSDDDYCPKWQVDDIQEGVMRILREVYLDIDVHPHYQHDD